MWSLQILVVVGLTVQLCPTGQGSVALSVAQTTLISSCIVGMIAVILRTPFFKHSGGPRNVSSNVLAYISTWLTIVGIVGLTWATQDRVVAVIVTAVFACCLCIVAGCERHAVYGESK